AATNGSKWRTGEGEDTYWTICLQMSRDQRGTALWPVRARIRRESRLAADCGRLSICYSLANACKRDMGAADCGRLSICYSRQAKVIFPSFAADCGRLSICYSRG